MQKKVDVLLSGQVAVACDRNYQVRFAGVTMDYGSTLAAAAVGDGFFRLSDMQDSVGLTGGRLVSDRQLSRRLVLSGEVQQPHGDGLTVGDREVPWTRR